MNTLLSFYPAVLLYGLVAVLKLAGTDWGTDLPGMHAGIGAMFLMFGASACHLVFVYQLRKPQQTYRLHQAFWVVGTIAFICMFLDSSFGVHERYAPMLGVPEVTFLLAWGLMFGLSVLVNIRRIGLQFLAFFVAFGIVSLIAVAGDMSAAHEGLFTFNGRTYSYEQTMETLGCLFLACAYGCAALRSILPAPVAAAVPASSTTAAGLPPRNAAAA
ncbi:MAG: hypothetical protein ACRYGO_17610 [Janthinobacterium lividum]